MSDHTRLYLETTLFDRLLQRLRRGLARCLPRDPLQRWCRLFQGLAGGCLAAAAGLGSGIWLDAALPRRLADLGMALLLLAAAGFFLRVAQGIRPSVRPQRRTSAESCAAGTPAGPGTAGGAPPSPSSREGLAFLRAIRAAGINVRIATALYRAGIRSMAQVRRLDDAALQSIPGVGPATVRRLRAHCAGQAHRGGRAHGSP